MGASFGVTVAGCAGGRCTADGLLAVLALRLGRRGLHGLGPRGLGIAVARRLIGHGLDAGRRLPRHRRRGVRGRRGREGLPRIGRGQAQVLGQGRAALGDHRLGHGPVAGLTTERGPLAAKLEDNAPDPGEGHHGARATRSVRLFCRGPGGIEVIRRGRGAAGAIRLSFWGRLRPGTAGDVAASSRHPPQSPAGCDSSVVCDGGPVPAGPPGTENRQ